MWIRKQISQSSSDRHGWPRCAPRNRKNPPQPAETLSWRAQAFGDDGLGILCIRGIPGYAQLREALLPLAQQFAELPEEVKEEYTDEASSFNFGWRYTVAILLSPLRLPHLHRACLTALHAPPALLLTLPPLPLFPRRRRRSLRSHGKEALQDGRPDVHKGSFYANPLHDQPTYDKGLMEKHPSYYRPNVWPQQHLPQLEQAFKQLGRLVIDTGMLLAAHCDR